MVACQSLPLAKTLAQKVFYAGRHSPPAKAIFKLSPNSVSKTSGLSTVSFRGYCLQKNTAIAKDRSPVIF
jgi:hypothetical protein